MYSHLDTLVENLDEKLDTPTVFDPEHEEYSEEDIEKQNRQATLLGMMASRG